MKAAYSRTLRDIGLADPYSLPVDIGMRIGQLGGDEALVGYARGRRRGVLLSRMRYEDYLSTPEWGATRAAALRRADDRCEGCGSMTKLLQVHHASYDRRGDEDPASLIVLCDFCHENQHR